MRYFVDAYEYKRRTSEDLELDIKWDAELSSYLERDIAKKFEDSSIISSLYRPFTKKHFYFDKHFNGRTYQMFNICPLNNITENLSINLTTGGSDTFCCFRNEERI